jgi:hypothetical protein
MTNLRLVVDKDLTKAEQTKLLREYYASDLVDPPDPKKVLFDTIKGLIPVLIAYVILVYILLVALISISIYVN